MRRLSQSDIQYRPYLNMLPWEDSADQIYNTDPIYIYYHEKTKFIRYTIPTLSTYVTMRRLNQSDKQYRPYLHMLPWEDSVNQINNTDHIYICYHEKTQSIRHTIPTLSTYITHEKTQSIRYTIPNLSAYATMRRLSQSDIQYRPYLHMLPRENSVNQIYNTDPICICYQEKTQSIRYTISTLSTYITHEKTQSIRYTIPTLSTYITHEKTQSIRYTIPTLSTYVTMRRLNQSDIQYRPYLHILPWEDSVNQIYNTDPIYIYYNEKTKFIRYTIPTLSTYVTLGWLSQSDIQYRSYLHILSWEDSVNQIYNTDPICICYHEKTQSIRYIIPTLSTYVTKRRLSQSIYNTDLIYIYYPWEDSVNQIYNTDPIYICYHEKIQSIRYTIPTISTYVTMRRLSQSDIQYRPYLHMLPREDSVNRYTIPTLSTYITHEKIQSIRYTIPTLSTYITHEKTQSIRYTIPTLSAYATMRRLSQSDIQYRPYLHMLPRENSVNQIYNTDPICICYQEKTQSIRYTISTLSTYITHEKTQSIRYTIRPYLHILPMRRLSQSDIQYRPYLHMLPWEDSINQIYNTDPIYIYYHEKTQSIRYTIPTLSTYITMRRLSSSDTQSDPIYICYPGMTQSIRYTIPIISTYIIMRRLSQSDIQYRPYLHMLPWEDSVNQIYNTDPIYICYQEKTQSIDIQYRPYLHILPMRRFSQSDIQYRPYLHMLPWEDSINQIYNTDHIYICYHEKTQSIRHTIPTLSTYVTKRRLSQSIYNTDPIYIYYPWEDSVNQIYNTDPIYICYHEKIQSIRYTIPTISTYVTMRRLSQSDIQYRPYLHILPMRRLSQSDIQYRPYLDRLPWEDSVNQIYNTDPIYICYEERTQSIIYTIPTLSAYATMRRLSQSDIQYRPYLHMLPREDSVKQIYNTDPIYIYYPWEDSVNQIYNTYPIYIYYPWEDSVNQIYNTDPIYIYDMRRLSQSDIQYRPYLHILQWED